MNRYVHTATTHRMARRHRALWAGFVLSAVTFGAACGDDDPDEAAVTTAPAADLTEYCALATEMEQQQGMPTADQMTRYKELVPAEASDAANLAADAMIPVADDMVAMFNAFAIDEVSDAIDELDAFEAVTCGLEARDGAATDGSSTEIEADAARVDVVAKDYAFEAPSTLAAGRTSFVLTNQGAEAHFLLVTKLKDGVSMEEALAMEDSSAVIEGEWETGSAAAGGDDEEVITLDLVPGTYALLCFIPNAEGTPHAFMGMAAEVVVG